MNKEKLVNQIGQEVFCRLAPSKIHGVGVIAIRRIPKGTNPFKEKNFGGFLKVTVILIKRSTLHQALQAYIKDMCVEEERFYYLPKNGLNSIGIGWYLNHSKTPNMEAVEEGSDFITLRDIEEGEELTVDYGTYGEENLK